MPQITNLSPTTELEAINAMLAALGEAPITDVDAATQADVVMAVNALRDTCREVQSMGWKFNTEFGYQLAPALTFAYLDRSGQTTGLNVFVAPDRLIRHTISNIVSQMGFKKLDTVLRPAATLVATISGESVSQVSDLTVSGSRHPMVFYDRVLNRDGFDSADPDRQFIYIDPVWLFNFEEMPEEARRFCLVLAMRRFLSATAPSTTLVGFTENDQRIALRNLKVAHGLEDDYNMLDNSSLLSQLGWRPSTRGHVISDPRRKSPGSAN